MSYCTFRIIKGKKSVLRSEHYTQGHALIQLKYKDPLKFGTSDLSYSDTGKNPAVIVDFNKKIVTSTKQNVFDDYFLDVKPGWRYINKEF